MARQDDYFLPRCSLVFQQLISILPEQTIIIEVARPGYDNSKHLASTNSLSNLTLINFLSKVLDKQAQMVYTKTIKSNEPQI